MYCKYCGSEIDDNIYYCPYCGEAVAETEIVPEEEHETVAYTDREKLQTYLQYVYNVVDEASSYEEETNRILEKYNRWNNSCLFMLIDFVIILGIVFIAGLTIIGHVTEGMEKWVIEGYEMTAGALVGFLVLHKLRKTLIDRMAAKKAQPSYDQAGLIYAANQNHLAQIPPEYWDRESISYIYKMISTGRASNLPEAFAMADQNKHMQNVEESFRNMQDQLTSMGKDIEAAKEYARDIKWKL